MPLASSVLPFPVLTFPVFDDQLEELVGQGDAAATSPGLDLDLDRVPHMPGLMGGVSSACTETAGCSDDNGPAIALSYAVLAASQSTGRGNLLITDGDRVRMVVG